MARQTHILIGIGAASIVAAIVIFAWMRTGPSTLGAVRADRERVRVEFVARGKREYAKLQTRPVTEFQGSEDLRGLLADSDWVAEPPPGCGGREAVIAAASDFLANRFINQSRSVYESWLEKEGYGRKPYTEMIGLVSLYYELYYGEPPPKEPADIQRLFARLWEAQVDKKDPRTTVTRIASDAGGLTVGFGRITPTEMAREPFREKEPRRLGKDLWIGAAAASSPNWWTRGATQTEMFKRYGSITFAEVGAILEFGNGSRRPVFLTLYWEPDRKAWRVEHVSQYNYDTDECRVLIW